MKIFAIICLIITIIEEILLINVERKLNTTDLINIIFFILLLLLFRI